MTLLAAGVVPLAAFGQSCTGLCLQQITCRNGGTTTISGKVFAPNGTDPLPGVLVYVPNGPLQPLPDGVQCLQSGQPASGSPLISTTTSADGSFTLSNAPVGSGIPLVIQAGKWRRTFSIPSVSACANTTIPTTGASQIRFPRSRSEGDIPKIGIVTGSVDALECVMRKIGIADSEFTLPSQGGRIQLFTGKGDSGANLGTGTPTETTLVSNTSTMNGYDLLMFACQGNRNTQSAAVLSNIMQYANLGGRLFLTHFNYDKIYTNGAFADVANWNPDQGTPQNQTAFVDTSFPKGKELSQWLQNVGASTTLGQIPVTTLRNDQNGVIAPAQSFLSIKNPAESIQFTVNTPVAAPTANQCGRVLFNEYHVEDVSDSSGMVFPNECSAGAITPQERLLEYSIFDLSTFVSPDLPPTASVSFTNATPVTQGDKADSVLINFANTSTTKPMNPSVIASVFLPKGLSPVTLAPPAGNTSGWNCNPSTLTCTRTTGLDANAVDPLLLTFSVDPAAPLAQTITASLAGGGLAATVTNTTSFPVRVVPTLQWANPSPILYGTPLSSSQLNASATAGGVTVPGTYTYTPAAGTVPSPGYAQLSVTFTPDDPTTYTSATTTISLQVNQAAPTIKWPAPTAITYGMAIGSAQLNATASYNGSAVPGTYAYTPSAGTIPAAGTQTLQVTFTPTDVNAFTSVTANIQLQVNQATPSVTWPAPAPIPYGTPLGDGQLNAASTIPGTFTYTPPAGKIFGAGTQTLQVLFTPTDSVNYTTATSSTTVQVNRATPSLTWATPSAITYGTPLSNSQLNAASTIAGNFTYTPSAGTVLASGNQTLQALFTPTDSVDYSTATSSVVVQVNRATPAIAWAAPAAITYGTALSAAQLNASSTVAGTFTYNPAIGAVPAAGSQSLQVNFSPTDTANYTAAVASVPLQVNQATPTLTWAAPAPVTYGTALSAAQLNATSTIPGVFTYSPAAGVVPAAGSQTLQVTFTPADPVNYASATASTTLQVNKGQPTITWGVPAPITYGTALTSTQLNATSTVAGTFLYSAAAGTVLGAGNQTLQVTFSPTDTTNYGNATSSVVLQVNQATPSVTWPTPAAITYGTALSAGQLNASASVPGTFVYAPAAGTVLNAGAQTLVATFTPQDIANVKGASAAVSLLVNAAVPILTFAVPNHVYGDAPFAIAASSSSNGAIAYSVVSGPATVAGQTVTLTGAGTVQLRATQAAAGNYTAATAQATFTVAVPPTPVTLALLSTSLVYPLPPAFEVRVGTGPRSTAPTGTVTIMDGATPVGTYPVIGLLGGISLGIVLPPLNAGQHSLTAVYSGDKNYPAGISPIVMLKISPGPVQVSILCASNVLSYGKSTSCTIAVTEGALAANGTISYTLAGGVSGAATLSGGKAVIPVAGLPLGNNVLTVNYAAQGNFLGDSSSTTIRVVR